MLIVVLWYSDNMAIKSYRTKGTRDIAASRESKDARKELPVELHSVARRRLAFLYAAESLQDLKSRKGLRLHKLKKDRQGEHAFAINDQYRICFIWTGKDAEVVEITDYH